MEENLHCLRKGTRLIGRYIIEGVLGQGGFGITYLGIDELHEKKVAIKEFFPQGIVTRNIEYQDTVTVTFVGEKDNYEKGKERFLKEARTMAKFSKDEGIVHYPLYRIWRIFSCDAFVHGSAEGIDIGPRALYSMCLILFRRCISRL